ncbi:MAG: Peptidase flavivirus helicase [Bryobacterales bacterium]|nr:Peptidase flavivirus helicase [Bryobacterales bacterium]
MVGRFLPLLVVCGLAAGQRPPVLLVDGYHLLCQKDNLSSQHDFGELEQRLNAEGVRTAFFATCSVSGRPSIEDLGNTLGAAIRSLNVPQVDLVTHSMGGLIVRSYLSGKQSSGAVFNPPMDPKVRKWVSIATPNFGALLPTIALPFLPDAQARELVPANRFLFDLATWNQNRDDLRGVDTVGIIGNAGGVGPVAGSNDGTVAVTSASMSFALPDERTRVLPYCHGAGDLTSILGLGCDSPPLAKIQTDNPLSWQIIDSFLTGTDDWKTIGHSPSHDSYLSNFGGILRQTRDRNDSVLGSLTDQPFVTNPPLKGGYTVMIDKPGPQILLAIPSAAFLPALSLAPRMLVSIYGNNLAGSAVTINGRSLPVNYGDDHQINTLFPGDIAPGVAKLTVTGPQGSQTVSVLVEPAVPAIFTMDGSGTGAAAAIHIDDYLSIYLTGLGVEGNLPAVFLNGQRIRVSYAGPAPPFNGLDLINVQLPSALATGNITITVGRMASNSVTIPVQ